MTDQKWTCPECNLVFEAPQPEAHPLTCPLCAASFRPNPEPAPPSPQPQPAAPDHHVRTGAAAVAALVFVAGGLAWAYHHLREGERKPAERPQQVALVSPPDSEALTPPSFGPVAALAPPAWPAPQPRLDPVEPPLRRPEPTPALEPTGPLPLGLRVNRAIDRGVEHLQKRWGKPTTYRNFLGLQGLTLLECGVPENDPTVRRIAELVREQERDLNRTYELALAILFLDRLGDPKDRPIIQTFGRRLVDGQGPEGSWGYTCLPRTAALPPVATTPLRGPSPSPGPAPGWVRAPLGNPAPLRGPNPVWQPLPQANPTHPPSAARPVQTYRGKDNSNTQFAILGLWVAQRHGVWAGQSLSLAARSVRETQQDDGSWTYHAHSGGHKHSMTCAALLCLAAERGGYPGQGREKRPRRPVVVTDPPVTRGLRFLGKSLDAIAEGGNIDSLGRLYFLWSLERVAVVYGLEKVGSREWYPWAAELLVGEQRRDGSWSDFGPGPVATCFALLVLRRSNLTQDLLIGVPGLSRPPKPAPDRGPAIRHGPTVVAKPPATLGPGVIQKPADKPATGGREEPPPLRGGTVIPKSDE